MMYENCEKDDDESKKVSKFDIFWLKILKNSIRIPASSDGCKAEFLTDTLIETFPEFWLKIHLMGCPPKF